MKHTCNDGQGPFFGRLSDNCARCAELKNGAKTRSWNVSKSYQLRVGKGPAYDKFCEALKAHNCKKSNCGPICTAFDY